MKNRLIISVISNISSFMYGGNAKELIATFTTKIKGVEKVKVPAELMRIYVENEMSEETKKALKDAICVKDAIGMDFANYDIDEGLPTCNDMDAEGERELSFLSTLYSKSIIDLQKVKTHGEAPLVDVLGIEETLYEYADKFIHCKYGVNHSFEGLNNPRGITCVCVEFLEDGDGIQPDLSKAYTYEMKNKGYHIDPKAFGPILKSIAGSESKDPKRYIWIPGMKEYEPKFMAAGVDVFNGMDELREIIKKELNDDYETALNKER